MKETSILKDVKVKEVADSDELYYYVHVLREVTSQNFYRRFLFKLEVTV